MKPGTILLHKNFVFNDGTTKDKYLIIIGCSETIYVAAKTTSKGHKYRNDHGCQSANYYPAFLLTAGCCCLPLNTWICLSEFYEINKDVLLQGVANGDIFRRGNLEDPIIRDVQFCAKNCDDISSYQESIIDDSLAPH